MASIVEFQSALSFSRIAAVFLATILVYTVSLAIYRLWLSPLSKIPGPKLAALTGLYEFYWDCLKVGQYKWRVVEMHAKYGPIVRISPREVHINDPEYFQVLYGNSVRLDKYTWYYRMLGHSDAGLTTGPADLHRTRRAAMSKYFSAANVACLEGRIQHCIAEFCLRCEEFAARADRHALNLNNAFYCLTIELITGYALPSSIGALGRQDFPHDMREKFLKSIGIVQLQKYIPFLFDFLMSIPRWLLVLMDRQGSAVEIVDKWNSLYNTIAEIAANKCDTSIDPPSIIHALAWSPILPEEDKSPKRLFAESQSIIGAGTETVSNSLSTLSYHILANPPILLQLQKEINEAATKARLNKRTDIIGKEVLAGLPFLAACIKEGLRIAGPPTGRLPRINSKAAMVYTSPGNHTYTLPQGTPMSMCITDIHFNSTIFEDPYEFKPQRWIGASMGSPAIKKRMEHFYSPFGKGSRNCVGSELAKIQMLLATGNMFWKFDMDLFETGDRDVKVVRDCFAGFAEVESRGIRVVLRKAE